MSIAFPEAGNFPAIPQMAEESEQMRNSIFAQAGSFCDINVIFSTVNPLIISKSAQKKKNGKKPNPGHLVIP